MKDVYTLADLKDRSLLDAGCTKPARLAVIGYPIAQSRSPQMQQSVLDADGHNVRYIRLEITPEEVPTALERMRDLGFIGCNITIPHKKAVAMLYPSEDELSARIGAVNTAVFATNGSREIKTYNTDAPGFLRAFREQFHINLEGKKVLLLGASGGAGTALAHTCAAEGVSDLVLVDIHGSRVKELGAIIEKDYPNVAVGTLYAPTTLDEESDDVENLKSAASYAEVIIQASPLGLSDSDPLPLSPEWLRPSHYVMDIITHDTPFLKAARSLGAQTTNGLPMLVGQGAIAYEHWFGTTPDVSLMTQALRGE